MKIGYLVHDLNDAAVARRVKLLMSRGAEIRLIGFHRRPEPPEYVSGITPLSIGRTADARLLQRATAVAMWCLKSHVLAAYVDNPDMLICRNLEMLLLGFVIGRLRKNKVPLVYECLDIHRAMLGHGLASRLLRAIERFLLTQCDHVIVSSPAFANNYFSKIQMFTGDILLLENKSFTDTPIDIAPIMRNAGPPWVIGWFGNIRCRKSLSILKALVETMPNVQVLIAGKPAYTEFDDFDSDVKTSDRLTFAGSYTPEDLPNLYERVHFSWVIDYFEEGLNSSWLLPNRLYEGGMWSAVPLTLDIMETAKWLDKRNCGVIVSDPLPDLTQFFTDLTTERYAELTAQAQKVPIHDLVLLPEEVDSFMARLQSVPGRR